MIALLAGPSSPGAANERSFKDARSLAPVPLGLYKLKAAVDRAEREAAVKESGGRGGASGDEGSGGFGAGGAEHGSPFRPGTPAPIGWTNC
ncbi:MAG: hypothetical protein JO250_11820 [Armatimonadetes bacterium]|nr:hypothetical protein [Armatimonadota bacterium]